MKTKRITPYKRLKDQFLEFANKCLIRRRRNMWMYPHAKLNEGWRLHDLWERTAAAEQIGYDVQLRADKDGLHVEYIAKLPERPWNI